MDRLGKSISILALHGSHSVSCHVQDNHDKLSKKEFFPHFCTIEIEVDNNRLVHTCKLDLLSNYLISN